MPSGRTHAIATIVIAAPITYTATHSIDPALINDALIGCFAGLFIHPDLDQEITVHHTTRKLIKYTFGLGYLWMMLWHPYGFAMTHRSKLTHFPVIGTMSRVAYLAVIALVSIIALRQFTAMDYTYLIHPLTTTHYALIGGLVIPDTLHAIMDKLF